MAVTVPRFSSDLKKTLTRNADNNCLSEVLQRLVSGTTVQRQNSMDVISEVIHMSKDLFHSHIPWYTIIYVFRLNFLFLADLHLLSFLDFICILIPS